MRQPCFEWGHHPHNFGSSNHDGPQSNFTVVGFFAATSPSAKANLLLLLWQGTTEKEEEEDVKVRNALVEFVLFVCRNLPPTAVTAKISHRQHFLTHCFNCSFPNSSVHHQQQTITDVDGLATVLSRFACLAPHFDRRRFRQDCRRRAVLCLDTKDFSANAPHLNVFCSIAPLQSWIQRLIVGSQSDYIHCSFWVSCSSWSLLFRRLTLSFLVSHLFPLQRRAYFFAPADLSLCMSWCSEI